MIAVATAALALACLTAGCQQLTGTKPAAKTPVSGCAQIDTLMWLPILGPDGRQVDSVPQRFSVRYCPAGADTEATS